jgi:hypothetical protein
LRRRCQPPKAARLQEQARAKLILARSTDLQLKPVYNTKSCFSSPSAFHLQSR